MRWPLVLGVLLSACAGGDQGQPPARSGAPLQDLGSAPAPVPPEWRSLVGEYIAGTDTLSLLEEGGVLATLFWGGEPSALTPVGDDFGSPAGNPVTVWPSEGRPDSVSIDGRTWARLSLGAEEGGTFQITPLLPAEVLQAEALAAAPPVEEGDFRSADLVELTALDSSIALDIRYATTNNFMGEVFYSQPRAFLQRPAAEALVRAHRELARLGYGLLIHDGYRPWYVTKMFWDATPEDLRAFVANPTNGSRHNRGCAVDLTLFDLDTGEPVEMTGGYDEFSPRSFPDYPGGTSRQRWHRELLRTVMETQGFEVYEAEWWHFDYQDWRRYRIGNERFEELSLR